MRAVVDASDTFTAPSVLRELGSTTVQQNAFLAAERRAARAASTAIEAGLKKVSPIELATEMRFNPELKSQNFVMPGVIGLILQLLTVIVMATSIARERERGTMEQLAVTPLRPAEIFIGKLLPYFFLALLDTVNVMLLAWLLFGVTLQGHFVVVAALVVAFILGSLGVGQLISVVSSNQSQAVQLAVFYVCRRSCCRARSRRSRRSPRRSGRSPTRSRSRTSATGSAPRCSVKQRSTTCAGTSR